ncbi:MAG: glutathione S-transferase N-terminal domain-containing protein [Pseudomonadota bacterium]
MHQLYATAGSGNCFKPQLMMTQLGIPYRTIWVDVLRGESRHPDYLAMNPAGTVPFLRLSDDREIAESNAMLWALAHDSALLPTHPIEQAMIVQWMIFEQTRLEPFIAPARFFTTIVPTRRRIKHWRSTPGATKPKRDCNGWKRI